MKTELVATPSKLREEVRHSLNELDLACFPLDTLYRKDGCYWWIVYDDGIPVAFAGLKPLDGFNAGRAFLCRAGVVETAAGHGLQRKLIATRIRKARKLGIKEVVTYTAIDNHASAANLIRSGLHFYKPLSAWAGPTGVLYFRKELI